MCAVNGQRDPNTNVQMDTMWVGTQHGELYIFHASSRKLLLDRQLAIRSDTQGIVSILHMPHLEDRSVVVIRKDGCLLLFDDEIIQHKFSDDPKFDNCRLDTPLPVKCVVRTRNERPVYSALVRASSTIKSEVWCGCDKGEVQLFVFSYGKLEYSTNVSYGNFPNPGKSTRSEECYMAQLALGRNSASQRDQVWSLVQPEGVIMCWDAQTKQAVKQLRCSNFTSYQGEQYVCEVNALSLYIILITRPHRDHTPCVWRLCRPSYIKLLLFMSLSVYGCGVSANSFRILMATHHLVWLARPSRKRPEAQRGTDLSQKTRKCPKPDFQELHES